MDVHGTIGPALSTGAVLQWDVMNQGRGGWQHKHVRHLIDLVYERL